LAIHYATYLPALRESLRSLPYFRLHVLHEAEFRVIIVYTGAVFRWKGSAWALAITGLTSISFILTPYIFDRPARPNEVRTLTIQVAFILLSGAAIVMPQEIVARERERRFGLAVQIEKANLQLGEKNEELQDVNQRLEPANRQLSALNSTIQSKLNVLYDDLETEIGS
jgi:hypothetical protein